MSDQSRASGHCVARWAEALRPSVILVENVREFLDWGPLGEDGRPQASKKGATFRAWVGMLESLGYRVEWRLLRAADYGDPTTRERLFVQAVRGNRRVVWPSPSHASPGSEAGPTWRTARSIIDWTIPSESIFGRARPLKPNTLRRIAEGLARFGLSPTIVCMEHRGGIRSIDAPIPTITTARGGAFALAQPFLVQLRGTSGKHIHASARSLDLPVPTISAGGVHSGLVQPFLVEYYGTGRPRQVDLPLGTVTTKPRFGLAQPEVLVDGVRYWIDVKFRMLQPHELAEAQGFPKGYQFCGTKADAVRQIGNAVPCGLARALVLAVLSQGAELRANTQPNAGCPAGV